MPLLPEIKINHDDTYIHIQINHKHITTVILLLLYSTYEIMLTHGLSYDAEHHPEDHVAKEGVVEEGVQPAGGGDQRRLKHLCIQTIQQPHITIHRI